MDDDDTMTLQEAADLLGLTLTEYFAVLVKDGLLIPMPGQPGQYIPSPHPTGLVAKAAAK